jgi:hypothetical protein
MLHFMQMKQEAQEVADLLRNTIKLNVKMQNIIGEANKHARFADNLMSFTGLYTGGKGRGLAEARASLLFFAAARTRDAAGGA